MTAAYPQPEVDRICAAGLLLPIPEPPEVFDPNIHVHDLASFMGNIKAAVVLRRRAFVRFFSDLFLFRGECDDEWLEACERDAGTRDARGPPILGLQRRLSGLRRLVATCDCL